jgi:hypothetical protein
MSENGFGYRKYISTLRGISDGMGPMDVVGIQQDIRTIRVIDGLEIGMRLDGKVAADHLALADKACQALGISRSSDLCAEIAEKLIEAFKGSRKAA